MSVLERCPSYRESNKGSKGRQGGTLGVRLIESQIKGVKKRQGPTPQLKCPFYRGVRLERVDCIYYLTKVTSRTAKNKPRFFFTSFKGLLISFYIRAAYMPLFPSQGNKSLQLLSLVFYSSVARESTSCIGLILFRNHQIQKTFCNPSSLTKSTRTSRNQFHHKQI